MPINLHLTLPNAVRAAFTGRHGGVASGWQPTAAGIMLVLVLTVAPAHAIGLGEIRLQSGLGQALRASVPVLGAGTAGKTASCYSGRLSTADGALLGRAQINLIAGADGTAALSISSPVVLVEPVVSLLIEISCGDAIRKEFFLLLDPPVNLPGMPAARQVLDVAPAVTTGTRAPVVATPRRRGPVAAGSDGAAPAPVKPVEPGSASEPAAESVAEPAARPVLARPAVASKPPAAVARTVPPAPKNILRLSPRDGRDAELINAISLRLALADRLGTPAIPGTPGSGAGSDDARQAADRAAQSRFAALLRGEPAGEDGQAATEQKLQQLQVRMQTLEAEGRRLRLAEQRTAAELTAAKADGIGGNWLAILIALLVLCAGGIIWLLLRVRHLKQHNVVWDWEENVSAADAQAATEADLHAVPVAAPEARPVDDPFAATPTTPRPSVRKPNTIQSAEAASLHGWMPAAPAASVASVASAAPVTHATLVVPPAAPVMQPFAPATPHLPEPSPLHMPEAPTIPAYVAGSVPEFVHGFVPGSVPAAATLSMSAPLPGADSGSLLAPAPTLVESARAEIPPFIAPMEFFLELPTSEPAPVAAQEPLENAGASGSSGELQFADLRMQSMPVEEISDVMQEAEFWMSLHDSQRAVEVLEPYATYEQPASPLPWLYLFDLYLELGQREKYDALHERFQRIFNGKVLTWSEQALSLVGEPKRGIEDVPHVAEKITALWESDEIVAYLESLLIDDRDGARIGFDLPVYRELMFLISLAHERQQAQHAARHGAGNSGLTLAA